MIKLCINPEIHITHISESSAQSTLPRDAPRILSIFAGRGSTDFLRGGAGLGSLLPRGAGRGGAIIPDKKTTTQEEVGKEQALVEEVQDELELVELRP